MENNIILSPIGIEELINRIALEVGNKLTGTFTAKTKNPQEEYLSRAETAQKLKISLGTLNQWSKDGRIERYRINRRVLYKLSDVKKLVTLSSTSSPSLLNS